MDQGLWTKDQIMPAPRRPIVPARRKVRARWWLEHLEDRTLPSTLAGARPLTLNQFHQAHAGGALATPKDVNFFRVTLAAGDRLSAAVTAQTAGSALQSWLRGFDAQGHPIAA